MLYDSVSFPLSGQWEQDSKLEHKPIKELWRLRLVGVDRFSWVDSRQEMFRCGGMAGGLLRPRPELFFVKCGFLRYPAPVDNGPGGIEFYSEGSMPSTPAGGGKLAPECKTITDWERHPNPRADSHVRLSTPCLYR